MKNSLAPGQCRYSLGVSEADSLKLQASLALSRASLSHHISTTTQDLNTDQVNYRSLILRREEGENVCTATALSSSHGAVRSENQFYGFGQVCANACDITLRKSIALQDVPYEKLEK
ncbi:hypothetical protein BDZ45DRAFT_752953 [Acephala macrosclerotiorum]|nr:hypothetical protein BDZ45DRAFT_752953 [Acephala macrosclerotiorum]